ncbi:MAG: glycosyltransferase family 4 protein [Anaerolineales bacterium]
MPPCIGIDASRAISAAPTGTEGYSYHLIRALLPRLTPRFEVRLYAREAPAADTFPNTAEVRVMPWPRLWTHTRLSWEMWRHPPDLLFVPAHVLPLYTPARALVTVHDLGYRYFPDAHPWRQRWYLEWSTRRNVRAAAHVLADSQATRDAIVTAYSVPAEKITVVYPGYDSDLAPVRDLRKQRAARDRYGVPLDKPYVLHLGRIQPRKNLARLATAFAYLLPQHPELRLVLAGPAGWMAEPIRARVRDLGLERQVIFPGYIDAEDKAALISAAKFVAYPSLYEGFGFPALEAQACETPLLASNTSSLPEVVGEGGLLVDPGDTPALADAMQRLLEDRALRRQLILRGRENLARFDWKITAQKVASIIEALYQEDLG